MIGGVNIDNVDVMVILVIYDLVMEGSMEYSIKVGLLVLCEMGFVIWFYKFYLE